VRSPRSSAASSARAGDERSRVVVERRSLGQERALSNVEIVRSYLRGQNLEQVGRVDDATLLYERAVEQAFDAAGPYDRLIAIYSDRARHRDVERVAEAALAHVQTHAAKRAHYERALVEARKAAVRLPQAAPKRR